MAEKLTDRTAKTSSFANDDVVHIVDVSDTSQDPAGSSFKSALGDIYGSYLAPKITSSQIVTNAADTYTLTLADTVSSNHYLFLQTDSGDPFVDVTVTSYASPKDGAILVIRLNRAGTDDLSIPGFSAGSGFSAGIYTARYSSSAVSWLPVNYSSISAVDLQTATDNGNTTTNNIEFGAGSGIILDNGSILREGTTDAGAGGGIAQICGVGYELKWEAGSQYVMNNDGTLIREVNHKFNTAPTVTNDDTEGFYFGSRWILDDGTIFTCTDATTGAAIWQPTDVVLNFTFITIGDYASGISQNVPILFPQLDPLSTYTVVGSDYTLELVGDYGNTDPLSKTTGFIPEPLLTYYTVNNIIVTLEIIPGLPATFSSYATSLTAPDYARQGIYKGSFKLDLYKDAVLDSTKVILYTMDLQ
jgi:hypothetical protein